MLGQVYLAGREMNGKMRPQTYGPADPTRYYVHGWRYEWLNLKWERTHNACVYGEGLKAFGSTRKERRYRPPFEGDGGACRVRTAVGVGAKGEVLSLQLYDAQ